MYDGNKIVNICSVSVPLSGLTSVNCELSKSLFSFQKSVSVPLSGLTSVNSFQTKNKEKRVCDLQFPSPYRG